MSADHSARKKKKSEPEQKKTLKWYRTVFNGSRDAIFISDSKSRFVDVNDEACLLTGYSREELLEISIPDLHEGIDQESFILYHDRIMAGEEIVSEARIRTKDGDKIDTEFNNRRIMIDGSVYMHTTARDISDRKRIESSLRESEARYRSIIQAAPIGIGVVVQRMIQEVNDRLCEMLGFSREELLNQSARILYPNDEEFDRVGRIKYGEIAEKGIGTIETRWKKKDGAILDIILSSAPIIPGILDGPITFTALDISDRKKTEEALKKSEENFRILFKNAREGIYQSTPDGRFLSVNPATARMVGYESPEDLVRNITDIGQQLYVEASERNRMKKLLEEFNEVDDFEFRFRDRNGKTKWGILHAVCIRDEEGKPLRFDGLIQDISDRKANEEKLRFRMEFEKLIVDISTRFINIDPSRFNTAVDQTFASLGQFIGSDRVYLFQFTSNNKYYSNTYEWCAKGISAQIGHLQDLPVDEYSYVMNELNGQGYLSVSDTVQLPPEAAVFREELEREQIQSMVALPLTEGDRLTGILGFDWVRSKKEWPIDLVPLLRIISEILANALYRKQIQEKLQESETKYRTFLYNIQGIAFRTLLDFTPVFFHGSIERITGYNEAEFLSGSQKWNELVHPDDRENLSDSWKKVTEVPRYSTEREYRIICRNGRTHWVQERIQNLPGQDGKPQYLQGTIFDISERKETEEALRESEARFRFLFENSPLGISISRKGKILYVNSSFLRLFGYSEIEELHGKKLSLVVAPSRRTEVSDLISQGEEDPSQTCSYESLGLRRSGTSFPFQIDFSRIDLPGGPATITFFSDISRRKKAEWDLRESEERYRALAESSPDFIFIIDREGVVQYVNDRSAKEFQTQSNRMIGERISKFFPDPISDRQMENLEKVFDTGHPIYTEQVTQFPLQELWLGSWLVPLRNQNGNVSSVLGVSRDITEKKRTEERIISSLREKEILLRELNHRVKNNMQTIESLLILESQHFKEPELKQMCGEIRNKIRAMSLIYQYLQKDSDFASVGIAEYFRQMASNIAATYEVREDEIEVRIEVEPAPLTLEQLFPLGLILNELISNTFKHAFPAQNHGGTLEIMMKKNRDSGFRLTVRDNGPGFSEEFSLADHSSLGLQLVQSLVSQIEGEISLLPGPGAGFAIDFQVEEKEGRHGLG